MSDRTVNADWIAADWGSTHLRVWAMRGDQALEAASSDRGTGALERAGFEPALLELVEPWLGESPTMVVACGMVGSRQGWVEAPYVAVPCHPLSGDSARPAVKDDRLDVRVIPGVKQLRPTDVMRGEETQIAGYLARNSGFDGVLCLPGTHTKWVRISAGEIVSFRTFMTGEMYSLLSKQSVLRHSIAEGWNEKAFAEAVATTLSQPETLAAALFTIRAESLVASSDGTTARSRLSGLLIGAELAGARHYWLGQRVALVGDQALSTHYAAALALQGLQAEIADGAATTLAGLAAAHALLKETTKWAVP